MKRLVVIMILMSSMAFVFAQSTFSPNGINNIPDNLKNIRQYQDDILLNARTYDKLGNKIFSHYKQYVSKNWNGEYITMISASIFDYFGKEIKSYSLHSNAGLSILCYEYDNSGNNIKTYQQNNDYEEDDDLINKNPYHYISDIKNIDELINHSKIKEIELVAKKRLLCENTFDSVGNMITEISYQENGDRSSYRRNEYNKDNNKIYFYNEWSKENNWEYYFEYEKRHSFFEEDLQTESKPIKLLQSVRVDYDWREGRKRVSDITFYKYNKEDLLMDVTKYNKGEFKEKYIYEYNDLNQVSKRSFVNETNQIVVESTYLYDKEGNIIEEKINDFRSGEENVKKYRYEYEYYD